MAGKQSASVQEALRLIDGGMNPYGAAKASGAVESSVYAALKRRAVKAAGPVGGDPEAVLREMALAGKVEEVALIAGRLFLLTEELKRSARK